MKTTLTKARSLTAAFITFGSLAGGANAALTLTFTEESGNVIMRTTGTLDVSNSTFVFDDVVGDNGDFPGFFSFFGSVSGYTSYDFRVREGLTGVGLGNIGDNITEPDMISGTDGWSIESDGGLILYGGSINVLDDDTKNVSSFSSSLTLTWLSTTFDTLGIHGGHPRDTPIDLWGARTGATNDEKIQLVVSTSGVPEPSSALLIALGSISLVLQRRRL